VADEFIDFYEALGLPVDADRKQIRGRINEAYTEAQRNLDHRHFATRVEHQKMFEVILPRARYILLDDSRRNDYDQMVRAFRGVTPVAPAEPPAPKAPPSTDTGGGTSGTATTPATQAPTGTPAPVFGRGDASSFRLAPEQAGLPNGARAPRVEGLPASMLDPVQTEQRRDELWQKWKSGLEAAIARDEQDKANPRPGPAKSVAQTSTPASQTPPPLPRPPRVPAQPIEFDFGAGNAARRGESAPVPGAEELVEEAKARLSPEEMESARAERMREAVKEILMEVGAKAVITGAMGAGFPLLGLLIFSMGHFYPRDAAPLIGFPSPVAWALGLLIVAAAAAASAHFLSRFQRQKKALELAPLSLEDILRELGRNY